MSDDAQIFISYSHLDNAPLSPEQPGWITRIHESLEAILSTRLGRKAGIWRDEKIDGNDILSQEISDNVLRAAVLVSILTPRYIESDWCTREAKLFCDSAEAGTGTGPTIGNKARVFKIIKTPIIDDSPLPDAMRKALGYEFFVLRGDAPVELDPAFGEKLLPKLNEKLAILAWDISELLRSLEQAKGGRPPIRTRV
jgi:hypothetical protein